MHLLQANNNISPLATLVSYYDPPGIACDVYGGAIIVRANRTDLNVVQDLTNQVVSDQMQQPPCVLLACPGNGAALPACLIRTHEPAGQAPALHLTASSLHKFDKADILVPVKHARDGSHSGLQPAPRLALPVARCSALD